MPYNLVMLDNKITTVSGILQNVIMTVSGAIPSLEGYATESWVGNYYTLKDDLLTTSGNLIQYIDNSLTTVSAAIILYSDMKDALEADLSYVDSKLLTTSGSIVTYIDSQDNSVTSNLLGILTTTSGYIVGWIQDNYLDSSQITTISGDIVSQIPSLSGYATELWSSNLVDTTSGSLFNYINTVSGSINARFGSRTPLLTDVGPGLSHETIQAGIDACDTSQGDYYLVRVFPGIYNEDVVLKDNVDMVGLNYSACILNGSVTWPVSTCTPDGWSCILDIYINGYSTVSGYSLITVEEGQHDLNNLWCVLTMSGAPGSVVKQTGGWLHGYLPEYQYFQLGETSADSVHPVFYLTGGKYEEQSGEMYVEAETSHGRIIGYDVDSITTADHARLMNPKISINMLADYFDGEVNGICCSVQGVGVTVEAGFLKLSAKAGGEAFAYHLDAGEVGSTDNRLISNANRIEVEGFSFNYYAETHQPADMIISHFDMITAQDGFSGDISTISHVHSDQYGELHLNKFIRFSPINALETDRELIQVDIGQSTTPSLMYQYYEDYPRLFWRNPGGAASFGAWSEKELANLSAAVGGDGAFEHDAQFTLRHDTLSSGIRRWRVKSEADSGDFVVDHYRTTNSGEGVVQSFRQDYQGRTYLRYGVAVDRFLNESDMGSYSPYALPTQKSVVDYIDTVSGSLYGRFAGEYATQEDLTSTSGVIMDYILGQGAATVPYVDTASGTLHNEIISASGVLFDQLIQYDQAERDYVNAYIKPYRYLSVSVSGGDFQSIQAAIDSITITDLGTEFWAVQVHPGIYYEDVYLKDNVDLIGDSYDACIIDGSVNWLAASGCSADYWSAIQNITIQKSTTASGYCTVCCDAGNHDIVNAYVWLTTDRVGGNCVLMEGGSISSYLTMYEYTHTGDTSSDTEDNHRCVRGMGGSYTSQSDTYVMDVEDTTADRVVTIITQRSLDSADKTVVVSANIDVTVASGFAGILQGFRIRGGSNINSVNGSKMHVQSLGGGTAYGYYVDSQEVGVLDSRVYSTANRITLLGFDTDYFAHVGSQDYFGSHFDDIICTNGVQGNTSTYQMVSSEVDGQIRITDHIKIGRGDTADRKLLEVDIGEGSNNPSVSFGSDYFGYMMQTFATASGGVASIAESPEGPVLMGSMSMGPDAFAYEQRLSMWAHKTDTGDPLGYERRGYRMKRNVDESFSISRHWTYEDGGAFVDLLNIDPWGGLKLRNSDVRVSAIYDEDDFASNSASGIATQRSTKNFMNSTVNTVSGMLVDMLANNGFVHGNIVNMGWVDVTRTLTITPAISGTYSYISNRSQYDKSTDSIQISDIEGAHFVYYSGNNMVDSISVWSILLHTPVAYIYWDKTNQKASIVAYEAHSTDMGNATHAYLHNTIGTQWSNGLTLVHNATTSGSPNADNRSTWVGLTSGSVWDEDIKANITNVSGTSSTMWAQDLGDINADASPNRSSKLPVFYAITSGGNIVWRKSNETDFPFIFDGFNVPEINMVSVGNWSLAPVSNGYFIYWVYGTTDIDNPVITIPHTAVYSTLEEAQAVLSTDVFNGRATTIAPEMRVLYKLIYQYDSGYSSDCKYSILRDVTDYRKAVSTPTIGSATAYHSALADLNISGHPAGVITLDPNFTHFLNSYTQVQSALERVDSYIPATYSTKTDLTSASGYLVGYIDSGDSSARAYAASQDTTLSGNLKSYTDSTLNTASGVLKSYTDTQLTNKTHASLVGLSADDHPQYGHLAQNETVSGNWTVDTKLKFNNYTNSSPVDGDRWIQSDKDFRVRSNGVTLVDGMNSMIQCRQDSSTARQDCNTSAGIAINWNIEDFEDYGLYGHSTSTNPSRITVSGTAWYKVSYGITHVNQTNQRKNIVTQLRKNGTTLLVPGKIASLSYNTTDDMATNSSTSLQRLSAGDYLEVMASGVGSVGTTLTDQMGGCWMSMEFVRWSS